MWPLLKLIPLRFYLYAAAAAFVAYLLWSEDHAKKLYRAEHAKTQQLEGTLAGERANRETERNDRKLADEIVAPIEVKVARIATTPDPVGVWCRPRPVPSSASQGGSTAPATDPAVDRGSETPLRDIGSAMGAARREAETNNAIHEGLIRFEVERTH